MGVAKIITEQLPQFDFNPENLKMFPNDLVGESPSETVSIAR
jgi:hypothetical protein